MTVILGIETSCDETAIGIVIDGKTILCNRFASHIEIHETYGGVFPEMSSRRHFELLLPLIDTCLTECQLTLKDIDQIAVATTPGLMGSLLMGVNVAKSLAYACSIPLVEINHIEAHLYAAMMSEEIYTTPAIGLIASGGHTTLVLIHSLGVYETIASTIDDAVGEAFDKVGRLLNLTYPAGPKIESLAREGNPLRFPFTSKYSSSQFSYSGLKTQALYLLKGQNGKSSDPTKLDASEIKDFAASFQDAALTSLVHTTLSAAEERGLAHIYVGGGVSNNQRFRTLFEEKKSPQMKITWPNPGLSLDNGAMIAGLAYHKTPCPSIFSLSATPSIKKSCL